MDTQLRRGILDISVLSVLVRGDSYGYQIIKDMNPRVPITESTLYPILKRLEAQGHVTQYEVEHNGRMRRFYRITDTGKERIREFIEKWQDMITAYTFIEEGWKLL